MQFIHANQDPPIRVRLQRVRPEHGQVDERQERAAEGDGDASSSRSADPHESLRTLVDPGRLHRHRHHHRRAQLDGETRQKRIDLQL